MAKWYVKELSKLTAVSVQTLHYYDKIGLLKPSVRLENGYRMYSEGDLLKLQQIIALKFFSFELSEIRALLENPDENMTSLAQQSKLLKRKSESYLEASNELNKLVDDVATTNHIPWQSLIKTIEVYKMAEKLDNAWVKEIFNKDELEQYAKFENKIKQDVNRKQELENSWMILIGKIQSNLDNDPCSDIGIKLGEEFMEWVNALYGKEHAHLRTKMFEQGYGEGKGIEDSGLTPELHAWIEQAVDAYWRDRIHALLARIGKDEHEAVYADWQKILEDMYGTESSRQDELYDIILDNNEVHEQAKAWLRAVR